MHANEVNEIFRSSDSYSNIETLFHMSSQCRFTLKKFDQIAFVKETIPTGCSNLHVSEGVLLETICKRIISGWNKEFSVSSTIAEKKINNVHQHSPGYPVPRTGESFVVFKEVTMKSQLFTS